MKLGVLRKGVLFGILVAVGAGCGDNATECGAGTIEENGVCTPDVGDPPTCGGGTKLDTETNECVIDPSACQDGTVLIGDECVDVGTVPADLEEAAEPNGLGLFGEVSDVPAGEIALKPEGETFVIHGTIVPFQDASGDGQQDPDLDTYVIDVTGPTLLTASVDGLHGLAGGFVSLAAVGEDDPLFDWTRFGVNLTGDTSKRQLYLPAAGTYIIAITDSRTLFLDDAAAISSSDDLDLEYYASITAEPINATDLTVTAGEAVTSGTLASGEVKLFAVEPGEGFNTATLAVAATQAQGSVVLTNVRGGVNEVKGLADSPNAVSGLGFFAGDATTVVVDHVFNWANEPIDFELTYSAPPGVALSRDGSAAVNATVPNDFTVFFYDVTDANQIDGFDITFDKDVGVVVADEELFIFSAMTFDPLFGGFFQGILNYRGLFRHAAPGRYYWLTFDVNATGAADITATSTIETLATDTIVKGTPKNVTSNAFASDPFTYDAGTADDPWQRFSTTTTGDSVDVGVFDPAAAFGRLGALDCASCFEDAFPIFAVDDTAEVGRILLDDPTDSYLVIANAADPGDSVSLDFARQQYTDLGDMAENDTKDQTGQVLDGETTVQRYFARIDAGTTAAVDVTPTATMDAVITWINSDESGRLAVDSGGDGEAELGDFAQVGDGWTAWTVTQIAETSATFDQSVTIFGPRFDVADTMTAFADACVDGETQAFTATGFFDADDEGVTAVIAAPADFDYFGSPATELIATTNGFITFDTSFASDSFVNSNLPELAGPNGVVAPYWDDLLGVTVCTKVDGSKLIVQWTGVTLDDDSVEFQAILDGADDTIEFVWGANQSVLGAGATIGVENQIGSNAVVISFNQDSIAADSSKKLTPQ